MLMKRSKSFLSVLFIFLILVGMFAAMTQYANADCASDHATCRAEAMRAYR